MKNVTWFGVCYYPEDKAVFMEMTLDNGKAYKYHLIGSEKSAEIAMKIIANVAPKLPLTQYKYFNCLQYTYLK